MNSSQNKPSATRRRFLIIAGVLILIVAIVAICFFTGKGKKSDTTNRNTTEETDNHHSNDTSGTAVDTTSASVEIGTLNPEDAPEPTLDPLVADDVIKESDAEPQIEVKKNQKTFNDCMEVKDYEGAKNVLDSFFAQNDFAIGGNSTYENYVYYYEKQGMYKESALYQIDFLEREMGLDNIVEGNTKYQKLLQTLKYVEIEDERIQKMADSVTRWKEINDMITNGRIDSAIEKLKGYIHNGFEECAYAYNYLAKAYGAKPDYYEQTKVYYIYLTRLGEREPNTLEESFKVLFYQQGLVLANDYITADERNEIEDSITTDSLP